MTHSRPVAAKRSTIRWRWRQFCGVLWFFGACLAAFSFTDGGFDAIDEWVAAAKPEPRVGGDVLPPDGNTGDIVPHIAVALAIGGLVYLAVRVL